MYKCEYFYILLINSKVSVVSPWHCQCLQGLTIRIAWASKIQNQANTSRNSLAQSDMRLKKNKRNWTNQGFFPQLMMEGAKAWAILLPSAHAQYRSDTCEKMLAVKTYEPKCKLLLQLSNRSSLGDVRGTLVKLQLCISKFAASLRAGT